MRRRVFLWVAVLLSLGGCARPGGYGEGLYRAPNQRWHAGYHTIRHGDTLYSIAFQYGFDYRELARWNGIRPPYRIYPGQRLRLRPPPASPAPAPVPARKPPARTAARAKAPPARPPAAADGAPIRWQWPAHGPLGETFSKRGSGRKGIDILGRPGQPVYAAAAGTVVYAGSGLRGYGKLIILKHNDTFFSAYAHNRRIHVKEAQRVKKGQRIADMGSTGAERAKLHFEIRRNGNPVNPLKYLPRRHRGR